MILNEDYFKELNLTDEDVSVNDLNDYTDTKTVFDRLQSYDHCIDIHFSTNNSKINIFEFNKNSGLWKHNIPQAIKKISTLFDLYGIDYSEPYIIEYNDIKTYGNDSSKYKVVTFDRYNVIIDNNRDELNSYSMDINIYFNLPKLTSYKASYKFICNIMNCLWKNISEDANPIISVTIPKSYDSFNRYYEERIICINIKEFYEKLYYNDLLTRSTIRTSLITFFPENIEEIENVIYNGSDKKLRKFIGI